MVSMNDDDFKILTSSLTPVIIESTEHVSDPFILGNDKRYKCPSVFSIYGILNLQDRKLNT